MTKVNGYAGYMTPFVWMFIKSYEKLRTALLSNVKIDSLIQLEYSAFEEATVPINTFVLKNTKNDETGTYLRLSDFKGGMMIQAEKVQEAIADPGVKYLYRTNQTNFQQISGNPISYWASTKDFQNFSNLPALSSLSLVKKGMFTGNNSMFIRQWTEISYPRLCFQLEAGAEVPTNGYVPLNKGGAYRKWYGNHTDCIRFDSDAYNRIQKNGGHRSPDLYFRPNLTWTKITSGAPSFRYSKKGYINNDASMIVYQQGAITLFQILSVVNSKIASHYLSLLNESMNYTAGDIARIPLTSKIPDRAVQIVRECIQQSTDDWNSQEISWSFLCVPFLCNIAEHTVLVICHIHRRISKIRVTAKHPFKKLATWWHKIQNVPKKCQTFGLGGH